MIPLLAVGVGLFTCVRILFKGDPISGRRTNQEPFAATASRAPSTDANPPTQTEPSSSGPRLNQPSLDNVSTRSPEAVPTPYNNLPAVGLSAMWTEGAEEGTLALRRGSREISISFRAFRMKSFRPASSSLPVDIPSVFVASRKVTRSDWSLVMGAPPAWLMPEAAVGNDEFEPLSNVRWDETQLFTGAVSSALGGGKLLARLPWEWEWEAMATSNPAGAPSDLLGSIGEWTGDAWNKDARSFPTIGNSGELGWRGDRVYRGVLSHKRDYTLSNSFHRSPSTRLANCGFRICLAPIP